MAHSNPFLVDQSLAGDRQVDALLIKPGTYEKLKQQMIKIIIQLDVKDKDWTPEKNEITSETLIGQIEKRITTFTEIKDEMIKFIKVVLAKDEKWTTEPDKLTDQKLLKTFHDKINFLIANATDFQTTINSLTRQNESKDQRITQLQEAQLELENQNREFAKTIVQYQDEWMSMTAKIKQLEKDKDDLSSKLSEMSSFNKILKEEHTTLENDKSELQSTIQDMQSKIDQANYQLEKNKQQMNVKDKEIANLKTENKKLNGIIEQKDDIIKHFKPTEPYSIPRGNEQNKETTHKPKKGNK